MVIRGVTGFTPGPTDIVPSVSLAQILGPLANNGGPTQTHALVVGSPAIDAGNPNGCLDNAGMLLPTDQRGFARHVDANNDGTVRCDIRAYEANAVMGNAAFVFQQYIDFLDRGPDAHSKNSMSGMHWKANSVRINPRNSSRKRWPSSTRLPTNGETIRRSSTDW